MESPFIHTEPVIPPIFSGRQFELEIMKKALFSEKESILIHGNDAIGKSSIVSTLYTDIIKENYSEILPVRISAFDFIKAVENDFLAITTHQICAAIWTRLMKKNYSELLEESLDSSKIINLKKSEESTLKRIFRIVTSENLSSISKLDKQIGAKFYVEGNRSTSNQISNKRKPLSSFEFLYLLDELNDIIKAYSYNSIMVFCDELNHLPVKTNSSILRNYFDVFSSKQIQFIIIVVNPDDKYEQEVKSLINSFNHIIEVKPFKSAESINQLLNESKKLSKTTLVFQDGIYELLFSLTKGHPWWVQKICDKLYCENKNINEINFNIENIERAYKYYKKEILIYEEKVKAGLPFRKFDLKF